MSVCCHFVMFYQFLCAHVCKCVVNGMYLFAGTKKCQFPMSSLHDFLLVWVVRMYVGNGRWC